MIRLIVKFLAAVALVASTMSVAHAVECLDPALTTAIVQAMARAPLAGECNGKLYGPANSPEERVQAVKQALSVMYAGRQAGAGIATQKLPLKRNTTGAALPKSGAGLEMIAQTGV